MRNSTCYRLAGPVTFRRASTKILRKWGSNLQNVEKSMRAVYIPDGYSDDLKARCKYFLETGDLTVFTAEELEKLRIFLQRDQSGAEALIVAYEAKAGDYRKLFIHNVKPHVYVALKLFLDKWKIKAKEFDLKMDEGDIETLNITPIEKLKENPSWIDLDLLIKKSDNWQNTERYYYLAKQTVHSANYDIQWSTFIMNILEKSGGKIVLDKEQGDYFLTAYRSLFPEIPERNRNIRRQVDKTGILYNLFGHPYQITKTNITESDYKKYYAWSAQSTVGEITRIAFSLMQEFIESANKPWDLLADTHDSYLVQCPLTDIVECRNKMQEFMNQELIAPSDGTKFRMKSECQCGFNWAPAKKGINDLGLQELKWIN